MTTKAATPIPDEQAEARLAEAHAQRVALRVEADDLLAGIAACSGAYDASVVRGEPWPWPDAKGIEGDPSTWKRLPALFYMLTRLHTIQRQLEWQSSMRPIEPFACAECVGFEGKGYLSAQCAEHDVSPAAAVNMGNALMGRD